MLVAGLVLVAALVVFLARGKLKNPLNLKELPQKLGLNVTADATGFTFAEVAQAKANEGFRGIALAPTGAAATGVANTVATSTATIIMHSSAANPAVAGTSITFNGTVQPGSGATVSLSLPAA